MRVGLVSFGLVVLGHLGSSWELSAAGEKDAGADPELKSPAFRNVDLNWVSSGVYRMLVGEERESARKSMPGRKAATMAAGTSSDDGGQPSNIHLGPDPEQLPENRHAQAEPHLARSYSNGSLLIGAFQEGRFRDGGAFSCGYAVSRDGGSTWQRGLIPHLVNTVDDGDGRFDRATDPVAAVGPQDTLYLNALGVINPNAQMVGTVTVSRSTDGGRTWSEPMTVFEETDPRFFPDKNWLAVNNHPGTPTTGRLAVTFTYFTPTNVATGQGSLSTFPIAVTHSDDGGGNWSEVQFVTPRFCLGSQPVFLPDGSLAVIYLNWMDHSDVPRSNPHLEIVYSADGGESFDDPKPVAPVQVHDNPHARDGRFLPSAAVDRQLGVIHVVYQAEPDVPRILFTRSRNRGENWTPPIPVNDTPDGASVFNPAVAVSPDGQHLTVIFYDQRLSPDDYHVDLYLAESFDAGQTWEPNRRLSNVSTDMRLAPLTQQGYMLGDYQGIVPALNLETPGMGIWIDGRTGSPDPFVVPLSRTQGSTFETWSRLRFGAVHLTPADLTLPGADPDGDRLVNLAEYALGLRPQLPDANPVRMIRMAGDKGGKLAVRFEMPAVVSDVSWEWEVSTNLKEWQRVPTTNVSVADGNRPGTHKYEVVFRLEDSSRHFYRLKVEKAAN